MWGAPRRPVCHTPKACPDMPIGSILGGLISSNASTAAGGNAIGQSQVQSQADRAAASPWTASGFGAANRLSALYGNGFLVSDNNNGVVLDSANADADQASAAAGFTASPGYQFRLTEGINALDRSAAARGMVLSGAQAQGVNNYAQGQASSEYGNYINELNTMSGLGASSAASANNASNAAVIPGIAIQNADNVAAGNAMASGIKGGINSLASILSYGGGVNPTTGQGSFGIPGWT